MGLVIGDENANSGLSKQIYDDMIDILESVNAFTYIDANDDTVDWSDDNIDAFKERLKKTSYATAKAVVEHIQDNADVDMTSFYTWLAGFVAVIQTSVTHAAMVAALATYLVTNPIPTFITTKGSIH